MNLMSGPFFGKAISGKTDDSIWKGLTDDGFR